MILKENRGEWVQISIRNLLEPHYCNICPQATWGQGCRNFWPTFKGSYQTLHKRLLSINWNTFTSLLAVVIWFGIKVGLVENCRRFWWMKLRLIFIDVNLTAQVITGDRRLWHGMPMLGGFVDHIICHLIVKILPFICSLQLKSRKGSSSWNRSLREVQTASTRNKEQRRPRTRKGWPSKRGEEGLTEAWWRIECGAPG